MGPVTLTSMSIFSVEFGLPDHWRALTLVQLCAPDQFAVVAKRFAALASERPGFSFQVIVAPVAPTLPSGVVIAGSHTRPEKNGQSLTHFLNPALLPPQLGEHALVFVLGDLANPARDVRGDEFMDIFEAIYLRNGLANPASAAVINCADYLIPWREYFAVGEITRPEGTRIALPAWVLGEVKQRVFDFACRALERGPVVEIGRLFGGTAVIMGLAAQTVGSRFKVFSFDPYPHPFNDRLLEIYGVTDQVVLVDTTSESGAMFWASAQMPAVELLHVDGDHRYEAVVKDIRMWEPLLADSARIMFDDYGWNAHKLAGSTRAIFDEVISRSDRWGTIDCLGHSLTAIKRAGAS